MERRRPLHQCAAAAAAAQAEREAAACQLRVLCPCGRATEVPQSILC